MNPKETEKKTERRPSPASAYTPEQLVSSAAGGNEEAFFQLLHRMMPLLKNRSARYAAATGCEEEDLLQEGAMGLYRAMLSYRPEKGIPFVPFAVTCIENGMCSAVRRELRKKRREQMQTVSFVELPEELPDLSDAVNPESVVLEASQVSDLMKTVSTELSPLEKKVLNAFVNGDSYRTIAERYRITEKSAENAMQRVRKKLRKALSAWSQNS